MILQDSTIQNNQISGEDDSYEFDIITEEKMDVYRQTIVYNKKTKVEFAYLKHRNTGALTSTMLYMPDGTPKLYSGNPTKLVVVSKKTMGNFEQIIMYDSENLVVYICMKERNQGHINIHPIPNGDGNGLLTME